MWRHHPQALRLAALVAGGAIGDLRMVRAAFSFPLSDPRDVRLLEDVAGGGVMDVGCYCISAARMLAGEPVSVTAQQVLTPAGVDRRLVATLAHEDDVLTHFDCALDLPDRSELEAIGSDGVLRVSDPWHSITTGIELLVGNGGPSTSTSRRRTRTRASSTTSPAPSPASIRPASGRPTRSARRARSMRS